MCVSCCLIVRHRDALGRGFLSLHPPILGIRDQVCWGVDGGARLWNDGAEATSLR